MSHVPQNIPCIAVSAQAERPGRPTAPGPYPRWLTEQHQDSVGLGLEVRLALPPTPTSTGQVTTSPRVLVFPVCENGQGPRRGCRCLQDWRSVDGAM